MVISNCWSWILLLTIFSLACEASRHEVPGNTKQDVLSLEGQWLFQVGEDTLMGSVDFSERGWADIAVPSPWSESGLANYKGFAWYRKHAVIPESFRNKKVLLHLGKIDDVDEVYLNGYKLGGVGVLPPRFRSARKLSREYYLPPDIVKYGVENLISVRVYSTGGEGGIYEGPVQIRTAQYGRNQASFPYNQAGERIQREIYDLVLSMDSMLTSGNFQSALGRVSTEFRHDAIDYTSYKNFIRDHAQLLKGKQITYTDFEVFLDGDIAIADYGRTIHSEGEPLYSDRQVRFFLKKGNNWSEYGNHSRFYVSSLYSYELQRRTSYVVYLPPRYNREENRRYPVLYLFHDKSEPFDTWMYEQINVLLDTLTEHEVIQHIIVVMPDVDSSYCADYKRERIYGQGYQRRYEKHNYEQYLTVELPKWIYNSYRSDSTRMATALDGVGTGGFGAVSLGLRHPDRYASIGSMNGALNVRFEVVRHREELHESDQTYWHNLNPYEIVKRLPREKLRNVSLMLSVRKNHANYFANEAVHSSLVDKGIPHSYSVVTDTLAIPSWLELLPEHLKHHSLLLLQNYETP